MIEFRDDVTVKLISSMGGDSSVVASARVSTEGLDSLEYLEEGVKEAGGLINFLMRNRHGCFDSQTEVLTKDGWKFWPEVDGTEQFITLNLDTDEMEYQAAERLVRRPSDGPMIRMKMAQVDALVTPDHKMVAAPRTHNGWEYGLHPAKDFLDRSHRLRLGGGTWDGSIHAPEEASLIGFIAADGNVGSSVEFHLKKARKINWLSSVATLSVGPDDTYRLVGPSQELLSWAKATYTEEGERCLPRELLEKGDSETIQAMLDGFLMGDGNISPTGKITASTVSRQMVDDLQEAALKAGMSATETKADEKRLGAYGTRPLFKLTFYRDRNSEPRIGWDTESRAEQVSIVDYQGEVHCVTVPNGTLYVRRNGKPMWCGNTPFEHNSFTFYVSAPIFVFREFHRHRIGWSYNEESGRYKELEPVFYIPNAHRKLIQSGKTGDYNFEYGTQELSEWLAEDMKQDCRVLYGKYQQRLRKGVAKEVARMTLPVNIYSSMYATCNARSLMAFLSLRTERHDAAYPSKPQAEIAMVADKFEFEFNKLMPLVAEAFDKHGRVCP